MKKATPNQPGQQKQKSTAVTTMSLPASTSILGPLRLLNLPHYIGNAQVGVIYEMHQNKIQASFIHRPDDAKCFGQWFDEAYHFRFGFARVRVGVNWWFINEQGQNACSERFSEATNVRQDGLAWVRHMFVTDHSGLPRWTPFCLHTNRLLHL